ncbi:hypothetical protein [Burkholderia pyrrocinia]|uniref:hypothetical protein n=1 Tax=Burkholderia pyrrocinia TaxID=60550 RepID=UPI0024BF5CE3|nr:hypothetical protein [Burkholderia pyrrocinia]
MADARPFFGVKQENEPIMLDELMRLQADLPRLRVDLCVWRPDGEWARYRGTPVDALRAALARAGALPAYVCRPPPLVQEVAGAAGVPDAQIAGERFAG